MRKLAIAVLCLGLLGLSAFPADADDYSAGANPKIPVTQGTPENEELPMPAGGQEIKGGRAPTQTQMELYVPLTEEQQELPISEPDPGIDYVPGIEKPAGGTGPKEITDQVPAQ